MISLELAKKLKAAGLKWGPKEGDWAFKWGKDKPFCVSGMNCFTVVDQVDRYVFAPSLSQLLAGIEKRVHWYGLFRYHPRNTKEYKSYLEITMLDVEKEFNADTPEEAAGQALLWIIEQEGKS